MAIKSCWMHMHHVPHEPHPRGLEMDDECLGIDPTEATGMQCGKPEPHPAHQCEYDSSDSPPIPWTCDGVPEPPGNSQVTTHHEFGGICSGCQWFCVASDVAVQAKAHFDETGHTVRAQRKEITTWTWQA